MLDTMAMFEWRNWKEMPLQICNPRYRTSPMRSAYLKHGSHSCAQPEVHGHHQTRRGMEVPLIQQGLGRVDSTKCCLRSLALQPSFVPLFHALKTQAEQLWAVPGCGGAFCWRISASPLSS